MQTSRCVTAPFVEGLAINCKKWDKIRRSLLWKVGFHRCLVSILIRARPAIESHFSVSYDDLIFIAYGGMATASVQYGAIFRAMVSSRRKLDAELRPEEKHLAYGVSMAALLPKPRCTSCNDTTRWSEDKVSHCLRDRWFDETVCVIPVYWVVIPVLQNIRRCEATTGLTSTSARTRRLMPVDATIETLAVGIMNGHVKRMLYSLAAVNL